MQRVYILQSDSQSVDQPVTVRAIRNLLAVAVVVAFATCDSKVLILTCGAQ